LWPPLSIHFNCLLQQMSMEWAGWSEWVRSNFSLWSNKYKGKSLSCKSFIRDQTPGFWEWKGGWQSNCQPPCKVISAEEALCSQPDLLMMMCNTSAKTILALADIAHRSHGAHALTQSWRHKLLRIRTPVSEGFFTRVSMVLAQCIWASLVGLPFTIEPYVDGRCGLSNITCAYEVMQPFSECVARGTCDGFYDPRRGCTSFWEQYFHSSLQNSCAEPSCKSQVIELDYHAAYSLKHLLFAFYPKDRLTAQRARAFYGTLVQEWIRPIPQVEEAAAIHWSKLTRMRNSSCIIGVHYRGSDTWRGSRLVRAYFLMVDHYLVANPSATVFLATEDSMIYKKFSDRYGTRLRSQAGVLRAIGTESIWQNGGSHAYDTGLQVLVDSLLLSKCSFMLKSASQVSEYALFFEPNLRSFDFSFDAVPTSQAAALQLGTGNFLPDELVVGVGSFFFMLAQRGAKMELY